jgi:hypothetical protein
MPDHDDLHDRYIDSLTGAGRLVRQADARPLRVPYRNTRDAAIRCETFTLWNRTSGLALFTLIGMCGSVAVLGTGRPSHPGAWVWFPVLHVLGFLGFLVYIQFLLWAAIRGRFPKPDSDRFCISNLTAEGFFDLVPEKLIRLPWWRIRWIGEVGGDIFFWTLLGGCYIPRHAFKSRDAAHQFHQAALVLWRSRGAEWPGDIAEPAAGKASGATFPALPEFDPDPIDVPPFARAARWCVALLVVDYLILASAGQLG